MNTFSFKNQMNSLTTEENNNFYINENLNNNNNYINDNIKKNNNLNNNVRDLNWKYFRTNYRTKLLQK